MTLPIKPYPRPPVQIAPYVDVLGPDLAVEFLLTFGGAEIYLAANPQNRSRVAQLVGREKAQALAHHDHLLQPRVPLANAYSAPRLT